MLVHTVKSSTGEAETGAILKQDQQLGLYSKFQENQGYTVRPYLKKEKDKSKSLTAADRQLHQDVLYL